MKLSKLLFVSCFAGIGLYFACDDDPADSLFDPSRTDASRAVVTALSPPDVALSGVGQITISGQNFSPEPEENLVFFDGARAEVVTASSTELVVKTPVLEGDSIQVKIAVQGAELFSVPTLYKLIAAVSDFGKIFEGVIAYGIASDRDGTVFFFVSNPSVGNQIFKVTPDGDTELFATASFLKANAMKMGPGNTLYAAPSGRIRKISTFSPDGTESTFASLPISPADLDFDSNGNIWVAGGSGVARVKPDKTVELMTTVSVNGLSAVRVFDGAVYVGGIDSRTDEKKIWRYQMQGEALGAQELVLDVTAANWLEGAIVRTFTFSELGDMILGTTHPEGIFVMPSGGNGAPLYPGLMLPEIYAMTWAEGNTLFAVRQRVSADDATKFDFSQIYQIVMSSAGAPYFGRQ